jgi:RHS repeat-associated protein
MDVDVERRTLRWNGNGERFHYYRYGEERGTTADGSEKFGTYFRDGVLDYADQRYYDPTKGRFTTPDRYQNGVGVRNPSGWNRFAYSIGDPINFRDPQGTNAANPEDSCRFDEEEGILYCSVQGSGGGGGGPTWQSCDENPFQAACEGPPISDPDPIGGRSPDPDPPSDPRALLADAVTRAKAALQNDSVRISLGIPRRERTVSILDLC